LGEVKVRVGRRPTTWSKITIELLFGGLPRSARMARPLSGRFQITDLGSTFSIVRYQAISGSCSFTWSAKFRLERVRSAAGYTAGARTVAGAAGVASVSSISSKVRPLGSYLADLVFQALYQGVLTAAISLALYGRAIRLLGASNAAAFVALGPIMASLMAIPALGEWPSSVAWAAITIITVGVYLASGGPLPAWRLRPSAQSP